MTFEELLRELHRRSIRLERAGNDLDVHGRPDSLDPSFIQELVRHKPALLDRIGGDGPWTPPPVITPEMLPLVALTPEEIDRIVGVVPGGAANVQDIYPLAPLQEGILFHHLLAAEGDPYLQSNLFRFESRERLDAFLRAVEAVIDRHDILRTGVLWEGLPEPVQVVWRKAPLPIEDVVLDPAAGAAEEQLSARFDPRHHRIDVRPAPLLRAYVTRDAENGRWLCLILLHHLAGDHTTLEVIQEEVQAHLLGRADELPAALPFRNFVAQARLGVRREEHEAFFRGLLADVDEPTAPFGLLEARGDGRAIGEARFEVEAGLARRLRECARKLGVTPATLCHVAWAQVLARTSGRDDVVFGTVLFGRMQGGEGADRVMGMFINTLPVRIRVGDESVEATVRRTQTLLADLLRHEHASLALAERCSAVPAPAPLFSALLNYRHSPGMADAPSAEAAKAWAGIEGIYGEERSNYPFTLSVDDVGTGFRFTAQAAAPVAPMRICELMHTALERLVGTLETAPATAARDVDVLPERERRQVVEEWSATEAGSPSTQCIHQLFEEQVRKSPDAVAVVFEERVLSYAELNARANQLAHHLRELGVQPDDRVAICVERGVEMVVGLLAALKAGGAYVPLDPAYPVGRLRYMLEDSAPAVLLTHGALARSFVREGLPVIDLGAEAGPWASQPAFDPDSSRVQPGHLAYVIYTSGSTGMPKGVMVEHRGLRNLVTAQIRDFGVEADSRVLQFASFSFDASVSEVFMALCRGASLHIPAPGATLVGETLGREIARHGITHVTLSPAVLAGVEGDLDPVRTLIVAGDVLPEALAKRWARGRTLINAYGPTEATVCATMHYVRADESGNPPIGRPIANARLYILDHHRRPVPAGVVGEIHVGGAGVARGYLNRPDRTAERFVRDPFSRDADARMYATGDLGRWLPDGNVEFLGRNDFQVKVRGFRLELGEIEARLAEHPGVRDAVVLAREDRPGDKRLVAYYTAAADAVAVDALRTHLSASLPEYMVPAAYVRLESLPLTPNGKVDRKALPAPEGDAYVARRYAAPQGGVETTLAEIWSDVLKVERVGRYDNFFELGGHSLLTMQVISRLRQTLGVEVPLGDVFARPVLADFARELETVARTEMPAIARAEAGARRALSFAQQRLWFLARLDQGGSEAYHIPAGLRLKGALDRAALRQALDRIVARHEALRTTFAEVNGEPEQRIASESRFHLIEHDLRGHADAEGALRRMMAEEAGAPFDLEQGPLVRGRLIQQSDDEYTLLITMHHIVSDAWSMGVLIRELSVLYGAHRLGESDPLPELTIQYADYAAWQRRSIDGEIFERQAEYWKATLAGAPEVLEVPRDHARPAQQDYRGDAVALALDERLTADLKALGRRHGATLFMTLLSGWAALLARLSGQDDVIVGTPVANRGRAEIEGLVGFFVNTLALRLDLSGAPAVGELLGRIKAQALAAQQHQDIPFEQVVELVRPARSLSHSPLFQVMFAWQNAPRGTLDLPGLELTPLSAPHESTKFDLTLTLEEAGDRIVGELEYATSLFERSTIERYLDHFRTLLEAMVAGDAQTVDRLPLLTEAGRRQVLEQWNVTAELPRGLCVHELFEAQAVRTPDAIAVRHQQRTLSYAELNARANQLAHSLRGLGVRPDDRVAICVERGVEMVVAVLAVLKAGGAYVPMDPAYPAERLRFMLDDSAPAVLLTDGKPFAGARDGLPVIDLTAGIHPWESQPESNPDRNVAPGHPAYVIYTSGSTGTPKGVSMPHGALVNLLWWQLTQSDFRAPLRTMQFAALGFDVSFQEIFSTLCCGAELVLVDEQTRLDPAKLFRFIAEKDVQRVFLPPAALHLLVEASEGHGDCALREVVAAGEQLRIDPKVARFFEQFGRCTLHNNYGPTETHVVTSCSLPPDPKDWPTLPPIGRPIANARIYILDAHREPVPIGVAGEIHIGGVSVARGYLNRPELTAERFVRDPFVTGADARMYRTGDLARWLPDGNVEFLGRNDFQVKVRGFRIELGEIEARLVEHPGVREAVVLAREDSPGNKRLVAYYTAADSIPGADALRTHLAATLPEFMVPAAYVRLERLPLSPNGKVDRKALPAPEGDAYVARRYEAPRGEIEEAVAGIWSDVLKVERVGRHDDFFERGGHSLLTVQVTSRLRQALGVEVPLSDLFARPVLADFARGLEDTARSGMPAIPRAEAGERRALSFAQQRLWFLAQLGGGGEAYHLPAGLRLKGELDRRALRRALDRIVARHEVLRTTFVQIDGEPEQRIAPAGRFLLIEQDLRGRADAERELARLMAEEAGAPFDLEQGPLVRGRLIRHGEDEHTLLITMHHIVSDGWSIGVLVRELSALYGAYRLGNADPLPELTIQYADYAAWQRRWIEGEILRTQAQYWKETLAGAPEVLELPRDHARPARQDHRGDVVEVVLDAALTAGLKALARRHGTTLFMTLLGGWAALLARLSGQEDVIIGTPVANRGHAEIEGLIGFFVNTLALRLDLSGSPTVGELLERVKARALAAQQHQDIPFEQVVEIARPARSLAHSPLFQVMFAWQNAPQGTLDLPGLELAPLSAPHDSTKFDLSLTLEEAGDRIVGSIEYATSLFERTTIESYVARFRTLLAAMVADEAAAIHALPLLPDAERRLVLFEFNDTAAEYPRDTLIHELFEQQAAKTPEAIAVVFENDSLTYAELNARANRLAHALVGLGVEPDDRVAVRAERSLEMVIALLGTLKAGGAYVPLDPTYPADRLRYMLDDAQPKAVLTEEEVRKLCASRQTDKPRTATTPRNLAYVIYTSGSTGMPKGVLNEHQGVVNRLWWAQSEYRLEADDRVLQKTPFGFDVSVWELFLPLLAGARLVMARPGGHQDPSYLTEVIARERITTMHFVPSMIPAFLTSANAENCASLRRILCSGEALPHSAIVDLASALPHVEVHNLYGPTEAAVDVTAWPCKAGRYGQVVPIGRPIANTRIYILDARGEPVPVGVEGELFIGGVQVARGYLNRPELTAERFIRNPFAEGRLYKTGDLGRWLPDGNIEYRGRNDFQVKVRGFRIELGEIEARLVEHPGVGDAVVLAREDGSGGKRLVAYYTAAGDAVPVDALRAHLSERLPQYMVPPAYVRLERLPLTPNGKIDRKALPAPEGDAYVVRGYEAPEGEVETTLAEIWSHLLGIERVGRHDHFFDLGGHSLLTTQLVIRIRQAMGVELSPLEIFVSPVLSSLASQIRSAQLAQFDPRDVELYGELLRRSAVSE